MAVEGGNSEPTNRPDAIDAYMIDWHGTPRQHDAISRQCINTRRIVRKKVGWGGVRMLTASVATAQHEKMWAWADAVNSAVAHCLPPTNTE